MSFGGVKSHQIRLAGLSGSVDRRVASHAPGPPRTPPVQRGGTHETCRRAADSLEESRWRRLPGVIADHKRGVGTVELIEPIAGHVGFANLLD